MEVRSYDKLTVRLSWESKDDNRTWDKACIYAVENFGLPGERFECHSNEDCMDFEFRNEYDALMFLMGVS